MVQYDPPRSYAQASRVGDLVFLAGEGGTETHTGELVEGGITEQSHQAFRNVQRTLERFGIGFEDLVRMDVFLLKPEDIGPFMNVLRSYMPNGAPPGALVCVEEFAHHGMLVEVECVAGLRDGGNADVGGR